MEEREEIGGRREMEEGEEIGGRREMEEEEEIGGRREMEEGEQWRIETGELACFYFYSLKSSSWFQLCTCPTHPSLHCTCKWV